MRSNPYKHLEQPESFEDRRQREKWESEPIERDEVYLPGCALEGVVSRQVTPKGKFNLDKAISEYQCKMTEEIKRRSEAKKKREAQYAERKTESENRIRENLTGASGLGSGNSLLEENEN